MFSGVGGVDVHGDVGGGVSFLVQTILPEKSPPGVALGSSFIKKKGSFFLNKNHHTDPV